MKKAIWISIAVLTTVGTGFFLYLQNKKPTESATPPANNVNTPQTIPSPPAIDTPKPVPSTAPSTTLITPQMSVKEIQDLVEAKGLAVHIESDIKRKDGYKTTSSKNAVQRDIDAQLARLTELGYALLPNGEVRKI